MNEEDYDQDMSKANLNDAQLERENLRDIKELDIDLSETEIELRQKDFNNSI